MTFEEAVQNFALPVLCMALIVMVLVGIVKIFTKMIPAHKNVEESKLSKVMSYFYLIFTLLFTAGAVCAYHAIFKLEFAWETMGKEALAVFSCTQALYPIYRDYGGRFLFLKFISLFKGKSVEADKVLETIQTVLVLTEAQKEKLAEKLKNK